MSTVEEHFAILRAMGPQQGGWLTDPFHLSAAIFLGAHLDELEEAWTTAKALRAATAPSAGDAAMPLPAPPREAVGVGIEGASRTESTDARCDATAGDAQRKSEGGA